VAEQFHVLLREFRDRTGKSRLSLSKAIGVDPSYWARIEYGARSAPRDYIVDAMAQAMELNRHDWDQLRMAGGYSPKVVNGSGWSPGLHAVARVLNDYRLSTEDRAEFERVLLMLSGRWLVTATNAEEA
jgi:transcriptional regulator with XRE-family HTH domain